MLAFFQKKEHDYLDLYIIYSSLHFLEPVWMNAEYIITSEGKCERCPLYQIIEPAFPDTIKEVLWDIFLMIVVYTCISPAAPWEPALVPRDACLFTFMGR